MKTVKMKQNKNNSVVRVASAALAAFVLFCSLSFPSFAYSSTSLNGVDFSSQPFPSSYPGGTSNDDIFNEMSSYAFTSTDGEVYHISYRVPPGVSSYYMFEVVLPNNYYGFYIASETQDAAAFITTYDGSSYGGTRYNASSFDSTTSLYYGGYTSTGPVIDYNYPCYIPTFSSLDDGLAAVRDWIDNPSPAPAPQTPHPVSFSLQPGYVAFVDVSDLTGVSASLSTSVFGSAEWSPRITDQSIGVISSLPNSFSIPLTGTSRISWSGSGTRNVLGQYKSFAYSYSTSNTGSAYIAIVNPLQASQGSQLTALASMPSSRNNPISVTVNTALSVKVYSLTASLALGSGTLDTETDGNTWSGTVDDSTGEWSFYNDQTGLPTNIDSLPVGGGNEPIIGETSINDWLQEIANNIKGFFSGAIGAVTTLVSAGSDFIHSLSGLYAWLPAPVYSVLVSALILVITIGVIKVFI